MNNHDLATWLIEVRNIMSQREFMKKAYALLMIVEDIDDFIDLYNGGASPMAAYQEYLNKE